MKALSITLPGVTNENSRIGQYRSLTPEQNERVCEAVRKLRRETGESQAKLAASILYHHGGQVSQQSVAKAELSRPVGIAFAEAVAERIGVSLETLLMGVPSDRWRDLPGWKTAAESVLRKKLAPPYAVRGGEVWRVSGQVDRVNEELVCDIANLWMRHAPFDVRRAAETEEARKLTEASNRADEEKSQTGENSAIVHTPPARTRKT